MIWERRLSIWQALSGGAYGGIIGFSEFFLFIIVVRFIYPTGTFPYQQ